MRSPCSTDLQRKGSPATQSASKWQVTCRSFMTRTCSWPCMDPFRPVPPGDASRAAAWRAGEPRYEGKLCPKEPHPRGSVRHWMKDSGSLPSKRAGCPLSPIAMQLAGSRRLVSVLGKDSRFGGDRAAVVLREARPIAVPIRASTIPSLRMPFSTTFGIASSGAACRSAATPSLRSS